jgi:hypothetical protein
MARRTTGTTWRTAHRRPRLDGMTRGAETMEAKSFVEPRDCGYVVVGSRVSLDSPVNAFWEGYTAESLGWFLPVLTLEQVDDYWGYAGHAII